MVLLAVVKKLGMVGRKRERKREDGVRRSVISAEARSPPVPGAAAAAVAVAAEGCASMSSAMTWMRGERGARSE